ncbi:MAG: TonB-dependent receptor [Sphingobacterium sp.]|uniref:TonB-dependent receptor n=1 Tax=Sphingobacterium sp. JB170 TaxID=1434842 RepID=UPI00097E8EE9|nr:TonB-dependent receptor [Sphingobacterium sp. JB170]SJN39789.1 TonB-dependent receptor, plug precursor [Sphingobacterium sp. JB170]
MRCFIVSLIGLLYSVHLYGQQFAVSGLVRNGETGETLIGAVVTADNGQATSTNSYGFYSLSLPKGNYKLTFSYVGFENVVQEIKLDQNSRLDQEIHSLDNLLEEVEVSANKKDDNVRSAQMGRLDFTMEEVKNVPVIFGEKDLLKTIQLLPGVQSGGEGSSNFYVRGGGADQNLILLDEATVYNASHLLGFFSTFNSDAIKDVQLYKGGIPAQYGGRISSVLDITMMEGNQKEFSAEGGIGLIASRLKIEAPIVKDRGSFMLSGRRTYADMFLKLSSDEDVKKSKLYFYDLNAKLNYKINDKNHLYVSGYFGKDDLGYSDRFSFDWGNATGTARWNSILNERLFSNTTLIYSDFTYRVSVNDDDTDFRISSKILNWNLKQDFSFYHSPKSTWRFGVNALKQTIKPASVAAGENANVNSIDVDSRQGVDLSAYVSHEWKPFERFSIIYGLRLSDFMVVGPGTFYEFDKEGEPVDEHSYGTSVIKHYLNLEPRFSANYLLNENSSVKASYNRMSQNLHQLTNTTSSLPTDQYVVSSLNIKPQISNQLALGYFRNLMNNNYEFSLEAYYKAMDNQIDFRNGADLQANRHLEGELLFGIGRAYGLEWYLRKNSGKLNGWVSYTLSKSERRIDGINEGNWFNARQDRTHDLSIVGIYQLSKKWTFGGTFVFNTGNAVTFPSGKYELDGKSMFYYTERNGYRMPSYHRLDISATYEPKIKNKGLLGSWTFGLYNVYNRKNAYIIDFRDKKGSANVTEAYKIALFGIIPSVTWNFKF